MREPWDLSLLTDLYELTMAQSYFQEGMHDPATFSLFIRKYPRHRAYFVAAGLEDVLRFLEEFHCTKASIDYLHSTGIFSDDFLDYLSELRFNGDVWAMPEGTLFFKDEPVLEVTAPIIQAQIVETFIINQVNLQTLIATKASRCVWAGKGKAMVDFSLRRTQGIDAGMKVARASYIAGFQSTSNVLAGKHYGIPISGTMAHSYVTSFEHEIDAFRAFARSFPDRSVLLIDTYDTLEGARKAVEVAKEMAARGQRLQGVRLDSGDLLSLSKQVRQVLDEAGLHYVRIVASGGLDEFEIQELLEQGAPIDAFGVGTKMGVSGDAPWSDMAYKLVRYNQRPVLKLSAGKVTLPDEKQVFRRLEGDRFREDVIALRDESPDDGVPLLEQVMRSGRLTKPLPSLAEVRERFQDQFRRLDDRHKAIHDPSEYPVHLSPRLQALWRRLEQQVAREELAPRAVRELGESR